jgi:GNAT superfamily N-acetyltransferase
MGVRKNRSMDSNGQIRPLTGQDDPLFWPALELYVESFPRDEREPLAGVAEAAAGRGPALLWIAEREEALAGLAYFYLDPAAGCALLVYLVTAPSARGQGVAQALIQAVRSRAAEAGIGVVFFECERPEDAVGGERAARDRRLAFFARRGGRLVSRGYTQPALAPDRAPVPLYLMAFAQEPVDWPGRIAGLHRGILGYPADSVAERATLEQLEV